MLPGLARLFRGISRNYRWLLVQGCDYDLDYRLCASFANTVGLEMLRGPQWIIYHYAQ